MQLKDVGHLLRQLKNYFPDSGMNRPEARSISEAFGSNMEPTAEVAFEDFLKLLIAIQRPDGTPLDSGILGLPDLLDEY